MQEVLNIITACIEEYEQSDITHIHRLNELLKTLTTNLFYLETIRAEYYNKYQSIVYKLTKEQKQSVARAENEANVEVPELYMLRHIMNAAYRNADAIRTNISAMKNEKKNN